MTITFSVVFILLGLAVLYRGQYEKVSVLDKPLIMGSIFFQFFANISILGFLGVAIYLLLNNLTALLVSTVILFVLNVARQKLL